MKRVLFTSFMVGVVALGAQARQSPPHIVLILCDDMGLLWQRDSHSSHRQSGNERNTFQPV